MFLKYLLTSLWPGSVLGVEYMCTLVYKTEIILDLVELSTQPERQTSRPAIKRKLEKGLLRAIWGMIGASAVALD